jgi:hypothetical protein
MKQTFHPDGSALLTKDDGQERLVESGEDLQAAILDFFGPVSLPVPPSVTARQARLALLGAGMLATVEQTLVSMPGVQGEAARIEWEYALAIERGSALINALAPALGLTDEQIDDLFRAAEGL